MRPEYYFDFESTVEIPIEVMFNPSEIDREFGGGLTLEDFTIKCKGVDITDWLTEKDISYLKDEALEKLYEHEEIKRDMKKPRKNRCFFEGEE